MDILKKILAVLVVIAAFSAIDAKAESITFESAKIKNILAIIEGSDVEFVRNGSSHTAEEAREHLQKKLDWAGDKVTTSEQFIKYLASSSSVTGQPYYVRLRNGQLIPAEKWLREKLGMNVSRVES